ncbi:Autophagy protein 7 [Blastomyces dermatitidis]|uniref:Ubiquitin-like modifier-activating enzyme ATG7 n=3 Tax=Blastomyces TaxID=229219 RepID=A0A179V4V4_BLAGS|nr:ubiquitin-like modifier-activating enzyme ATG7 [Blastomyces gilchristii SLH14081]XP_045273818.1 ubiquitin-like modifier-activating enzyme ATG7 [Blastomyces dermatitidis ER-3]EGE85346.1 ubiquitin-like modifier-activating enzyme ATG7 [Blastomyces dermatitidis ATCC 18188]EQL30040.1 ubiquitin-like modifier-activating enzyme ATG7 [Blastomyces dermatitidis ATCC 26199]EEQ86226.2 ubiquitin-like modifier-activating enzyme ATG7 [Blastomyces dermatitidis ER-3]OAT14479.1 ubiquitin-like modifier-activat
MQYTPFASDIELPFYTSLASLKINHDKLDDSARKLLGLYEIRSADRPETSCRMQIHGTALTRDEVPAGYYRAEGMIKNVNTIEEYRNTDKNALLLQTGKTIWDAINDGTIYSCPSLLVSFIALSFADLKKYKFSYWFAFPAIHSSPSWTPVLDPKPLSGSESSTLVDAVQTWRYGVDARQHGFFLARKDWHAGNSSSGGTPSNTENVDNQQSLPSKAKELGFSWKISSLSGFEVGFFSDILPEDCFVCFADPSNYPDAPGWMLRNLLVLVRQRWKLNEVNILRYRDVQSKRDQGRSIVIKLRSDAAQPDGKDSQLGSEMPMPKVTGWERNAAGKLTGRITDLTEYMDPRRLADQSVDLNLKLMKWRISPNLDLEKIKNTKCLLLGAGTLGSYVARNLLGWGVRKITFVDNGTVSFSNPVRQPLFGFNDCLGGGTKKALRAAAALEEIYPGVDASGFVISVPMPGHPITDASKAELEFRELKKLVDEHDAIFVLLDTREARWLPTVMGKATGKIVMNAALGFDTYVVMRHGVENSSAPETELGCYFCNDVVAPADSVKDQTLDQQCTVTRPGIAAIASALLVELFVSTLQHPNGPAAPASSLQQESHADHPLGIVPHQIRGFLSNFSNVVVSGKSYNCCSACSGNITDAYKTQGWDFVRKAVNERDYVEELSGLKEIQRAAEEASASLDFEESDFEEGDGEMI